MAFAVPFTIYNLVLFLYARLWVMARLIFKYPPCIENALGKRLKKHVENVWLYETRLAPAAKLQYRHRVSQSYEEHHLLLPPILSKHSAMYNLFCLFLA